MVYAVDNHPPFIEQVKRRAAEAGSTDWVVPMVADMRDLPFRPETFDLVWAEGSIYIVGVAEGLRMWRPLLKRGGYVAFSEISWLRPERPSELAQFWNEAYPAIASIDGNLQTIHRAGFTVDGHFVLPEADWWTEYYDPIGKKLPGLKEKYAGVEQALEVLLLEEKEIELFRSYSAWYGYVFSIATLTGQ